MAESYKMPNLQSGKYLTKVLITIEDFECYSTKSDEEEFGIFYRINYKMWII